MTTRHRRYIIHIEAQTHYDPELPQRMPEYAVLHWLKFRLPVVSLVLLLTPHKLPAHPPTTGLIEAGDTRIETSYRLIRLWEIPATEMLRLQRPALLPFVPLMKGGKKELNTGARRLRQVKNDAQRREMALHFILLGALRYNHADLLELVSRNAMINRELLRESSFYQAIVEEGRQEGRVQGAREGRQQGLQQGLQQELSDLKELFSQLASQRFPRLRLGKDLERINDLAALRRLFLELHSLPDGATLRRRIAALARINGHQKSRR